MIKDLANNFTLVRAQIEAIEKLKESASAVASKENESEPSASASKENEEGTSASKENEEGTSASKENESEPSASAAAAIEDKFVPVMQEFLTTATDKFDSVKREYEELVVRLKKFAELYGEDENDMKSNPSRFFNTLLAFIKSVKEEETRMTAQRIKVQKRTLREAKNL